MCPAKIPTGFGSVSERVRLSHTFIRKAVVSMLNASLGQQYCLEQFLFYAVSLLYRDHHHCHCTGYEMCCQRKLLYSHPHNDHQSRIKKMKMKINSIFLELGSWLIIFFQNQSVILYLLWGCVDLKTCHICIRYPHLLHKGFLVHLVRTLMKICRIYLSQDLVVRHLENLNRQRAWHGRLFKKEEKITKNPQKKKTIIAQYIVN